MKWLGPSVVILVAVLAELALGRAASGPDFALFLGRFHPLVVHLPIGFFLLVALAEGATFIPKVRDRVEPAIGLLIPVAAVAAVAAFCLGQLLALEGGFPAAALAYHRRLTLLAIVGMAACWAFYERHRSLSASRLPYRGALVATLGVLSLGAHFGGTMTRGESYLSKYAPGPLKPLLGSAEPSADAKPKPAASAGPAAAEPLLYADVSQRTLSNYCFECHGTEKQKGKLRIDSLELLLKGGESGPAVIAGDAKKSPLVARMLLPVSDDDHMPPEGKPAPKPEELALIQFWIERGASPTLKVRDVLAPSVSRGLLEHTLGIAPASDSVPVSAPAPASAPPAESAAAPAEPATPSSAPQRGAAAPPATEPAPALPSSGVRSGSAFLATYCEKCHGGAKQKGKLRVDSMAALLKGGAGGAALVPGNPEQSSLVQRTRLALDNDEHMPPAKEPQPSAAEVAVLAAWVRSGAASAPVAASSTATAPDSAPTVSSPEPVAAVEPTPSPPPASAPVSETSDATLLASLPGDVPLFSAAVQPLLREKCGKCHIRDKPAGGLAVAEHAQLIEGGFSGPGIVPKNRSASVLMQRLVLPPNDDEHMPPEDEPTLSADQVELVGAWIDQGAPGTGTTRTASLTAGAQRALSALGLKPGVAVAAVATTPQTLPPQSGGCGACSVPGALRSPMSLALQMAALLGACVVLRARRSRARKISRVRIDRG